MARGDAAGALDNLETAYALRENANHLESLAYGLYRAGNLEGARERYLAFLAEPEIGWEVQEYWLLSHYHLGQIYEQLGDVPKALESYDALLEIWKDGDPDLTILEAVRERVEGLRPGG